MNERLEKRFKDAAEKALAELDGGTLFGVPIDTKNMTHVLAAFHYAVERARLIGKMESRHA